MSKTYPFADLAKAVSAGYTGRDNCFRTRLGFWIDHFGDRCVTQLCSDDVEDAVDALVQRGKMRVSTRWVQGKAVSELVTTGLPLSGSSINRYVACLGTCFKELRRMRLLPRGFVSPMRGVQRHEEGKGRTLSVTVPDVQRLVDACRVSRNHKLAALVAMACTSGWRLGSLQGLRWGDLNLQDGTADTSRTKNGTPHRAVLLDWVVKELKRIKPSLAEPHDLVFDRKDFRKAWSTALERANLPAEWTFHHCRHIAASVLAQNGASVATIMQALNHKSPAMSLRYAHLNTAALRESVNSAWGVAP